MVAGRRGCLARVATTDPRGRRVPVAAHRRRPRDARGDRRLGRGGGGVRRRRGFHHLPLHLRAAPGARRVEDRAVAQLGSPYQRGARLLPDEVCRRHRGGGQRIATRSVRILGGRRHGDDRLHGHRGLDEAEHVPRRSAVAQGAARPQRHRRERDGRTRWHGRHGAGRRVRRVRAAGGGRLRVGSVEEAIDRAAIETGLSGVVRIDRDRESFAKAYGFAHRGYRVQNTVDTRFGIASGTKGFTALAVMSLVEDGTLSLETTARSILGEDLPLIEDAVMVEHLLGHRSGVGDYYDEDIDRPITDHVMTVPVHELATIESDLSVLDGFPMKFPPGERFSYCNGGYVVLALIAERSSGVPFHDLVLERVCRPAGLPDSAFLRMDEPAERVAT